MASIVALPPANKTAEASAVGFLRYAWREVEDVMTGGGVEAEYARDTWDARRLGIPVTVGHHSVSFARIPQAWLRGAGGVLGEGLASSGGSPSGRSAVTSPGSPGSPVF